MTRKEKPLFHPRSLLMTEDDTFRILARPNIHKMVILHTTWVRSITDEGKKLNSMWNLTFMKAHGWTWIEYLQAKKREGYPP